MSNMWKILLVSAGLTLSGPLAAANVASNGSFEDTTNFVPDGNDTMSLPVGSTAMPGWTVIGGEIAWIGPTNPFGTSASDGSYFLDLTGYHDAAPFGGVSQNLNTSAGHAYQVTFDLGSSAQYGIPVSIEVSAGGQTQTFTSNSPGNNVWTPETFNFTSGGSNTLLSFLGTQGNSAIGLDNIVVTDLGGVAGVPEPASWALMIGGFGLIGAAARRRRATALA